MFRRIRPILIGVLLCFGAECLAVEDGFLLDPPEPIADVAFESDAPVAEGDAFDYDNCNACGCRCPGWTVTADALFLHRSAATGQKLASVYPTSIEAINSRELTFDHEAGPRVSLIRHTRSCWDIEFNWMSIDGWNSAQSLGGPGYYSASLSIGSVTHMRNPTFVYGSDLRSAELNFRRPLGDCLTLLAGYRWVGLDERYRVDGTDSQSNHSSFTIDAHNQLHGFQMGAEATLLRPCSWLQLEAFAKAGVFGMSVNQRTQFVWSGGAPYGTGTASETSFLGEIGLLGKARLNDHWSLRAGYQLMWIDRLALAPKQIPGNGYSSAPGGGTNTVISADELFFHGAMVGLEGTW